MNAFLELEKTQKTEKKEKRKSTLKIKRTPTQEEVDILSSFMTNQSIDIVGNKEDNMVVTASTTINIKKRRVSKKLAHESYQPIIKDDVTVDFSL